MKLFIVLVSLAICATASPTPRVINGRKCDKNEVPYIVSVKRTSFPNLIYSHICGGVLIGRQYVLTAAQCAVGSVKKLQIAFRENKDIGVAESFIHHNYTQGNSKYDIAILKLKKEVGLSEAIKLINLPKSESECDAVEIGFLSGWGHTGGIVIPPLPLPASLECAEVPIVTNEECGRNLTALQGNQGPLDDKMICTGTTAGRKPQSGCYKDEGGPLANRETNTVIGIYSWGYAECGTKGAPSVYTKVCSFLDWIKEKTA